MTVARRAMACEFSLTFPGEYRRAVDAGCAALDAVERLESKFSAYQAGSDISYINRNAHERPVIVDAELFDLFQAAARLYHDTGGAFDVAAGSQIRAWGFFHRAPRVPAELELGEALAASGMNKVELDPRGPSVRFRRPGVQINLGSIGKGYAVDRALARIQSGLGPYGVLMQGGRSSVKALGAPPGEPRGWKVAIGDPCRPGRALGAVFLKDRALGTSGAAHQHFESGGKRYGHVLDPRTGRPADTLVSASALAPTAAEADALATAFFVLGLEGARRYCREHPGTAAILLTKPVERAAARLVTIGLKEGEFELGRRGM